MEAMGGKAVKFEDFSKIEIRIGTVFACEKVAGTDKLLKLEVDFGAGKKTIVTGMAQFFAPVHFIGKQIPFIVNLEPRKMKGIESRGMIIAADVEGKPVLLHPEQKVPNGTLIR